LGEISVVSGVTLARLHGDLDLASVDALRDLLDDLCAEGSPRIVVDLRDVSFVDVLSLSVLLGVADTLRDSDRQLVVEGASSSVRRLCEVLNAEDVLAPEIALHRKPFTGAR
jgi:anti-anti-sigma factor